MGNMQTYLVGSSASITVPRYENERQQPYDPSTLTFTAWQDDPALPTESIHGEPVRLEYGPADEIVKTNKGEYSIRFVVPAPGIWHVRVDTTDPDHTWTTYFYAKPAASPV